MPIISITHKMGEITEGNKSHITHTTDLEARMVDSSVFLTRALRNPYKPSHCAKCLYGALCESTVQEHCVTGTTGTIEIKPKKKLKSEFWETLVTFLFLKRSDRQIEQLMEYMAECQCGNDLRLVRINHEQKTLWRYHDIGESKVYTPLGRTPTNQDNAFGDDEVNVTKDFDSHSCGFIINLFICLTSPISRTVYSRSAVKGCSNSWPRKLTDMIPFGPDDFVESIIQWHRFIAHPVLFHLTASVLQACKLLVIPSLIKFNFFSTVVDAMKAVINQTIIDVPLEIHLHAQCNLDQRRAVLRITRRMDIYCSSWLLLLGVCTDNIPFAYSSALFQGLTTRAVQICSILLYCHSRLSFCSKIEATRLAAIAHLLLRDYGRDDPRIQDMPIHPLILQTDKACAPVIIGDEYITEALGFIINIRRGNECGAPGCQNTFQTSGRRFGRCARCHIAAYCSSECQTRAWKTGVYPHRDVCPVLKALVDKGGGPKLFFSGVKDKIVPAEVVSLWKAAALKNQDLVLVAEWAKSLLDSKQYPIPDYTRHVPGYEDYNDILDKLSSKGPTPAYLNRVDDGEEVDRHGCCKKCCKPRLRS